MCDEKEGHHEKRGGQEGGGHTAPQDPQVLVLPSEAAPHLGQELPCRLTSSILAFRSCFSLQLTMLVGVSDAVYSSRWMFRAWGRWSGARERPGGGEEEGPSGNL